MLALAVVTPGCGYFMYFARSPIRPVPALAHYREAGVRQRCLVVVVPGLGDGSGVALEHDLPRRLEGAGARCDTVALDATYRYYFGTEIADVLYADVLLPAAARGYEEIWLVGISLGGLGAVLTARAHPELVDGLVLLSPFLGLDGARDDVLAAGGLAEWHPPEPMPPALVDQNFSMFVWAWLRGHVTDRASMPETYVGWARGERLETGARLLGDVLPEGHALSVEGTHGWTSWTALFDELARRARIGQGAAR